MRRLVVLILCGLTVTQLSGNPAGADDPPVAKDVKILVGRETEKRFPPLQVPKGFEATLFACDPLVEYPSVIALGPEPGSLFIAYDYMTGLGVEIVRKDEVRLVRDGDGDGYADKSTLFAGGFNSIQGLAYYDRTVFVMHAPTLTMVRDTDDDGVADGRKDLFTGLGLPPEENSNRLHCANGVVAGHDGWLYLAIGDRGCDVKRPEGDRLVVQQGGILRCRPDGRDLHLFAGGLRNIYDVALDADLNVFVRDNENDGGDYMIRVCHCFHGSDHGYPYLYYERPDEAMPPLADLGRGSSAGGTAYLERAFPTDYQQSLYFCEWGRAVVRYRQKRAGSSFASMQELDFAAGAPDDPYGFKPTDLVVDYDGSLLISDWCDGQRPKRGRGRIYRVRFADSKHKPQQRADKDGRTLIDQLDSPSYHVRVAAQLKIERLGKDGAKLIRRSLNDKKLNTLGRLHAVWILAHIEGSDAVGELFRIAKTDPDARVRAQAVRAIADLTDPVLVKHRLAAGRGDANVASQLAELAKTEKPAVVLEAIVALGRLRWAGFPDWLRDSGLGRRETGGRRQKTEEKRERSNPGDRSRPLSAFRFPLLNDPALVHAVQQTLRRCDNWPKVLSLLSEPSSNKSGQPGLRTLALRAIANRADATIVDALIERFGSENDPLRRGQYVDALSRVYKQPSAWTYWGFRPPPRPANTQEWQRTAKIGQTLGRALADEDASVRVLALKQMQREGVPVPFDSLTAWLQKETDAKHVSALLDALRNRTELELPGLLEDVVASNRRSTVNRSAALAMLVSLPKESGDARLARLLGAVEDGPVLAAVIRELGKRPNVGANGVLLRKLQSDDAIVRTAAIAALGVRKTDAARSELATLLDDPDVRVRRAAATAAGQLGVKAAIGRLLKLADTTDAQSRAAALESLRQLGEPGAVAVAVKALDDAQTQLAGMAYLREYGGPEQLDQLLAVAAANRSSEVLAAVIRTLAAWGNRENGGSPDRRKVMQAIAKVQGSSGVPLFWRIAGPLSPKQAQAETARLNDLTVADDQSLSGWNPVLASGNDAVVRWSSRKTNAGNSLNLATTDLFVDQPGEIEFLGSSNSTFEIRLNGKSIFRRDKRTAFRPDSDRFAGKLTGGRNRLVVQIAEGGSAAQFHLRFRRKSSKVEHEQLVRYALKTRGNIQRGRELFVNAEKSLCIKCHRVGTDGGKIGPDLSEIGSRFSRIHLIESMLEPSRTIAPSYGTVSVVRSDGLVVTGVKVSETATTLTLGDNQGKRHEISKTLIDMIQPQSKSTMPDGLEKRLSSRDFADLLAYLQSRKKTAAK